MLKKIVYVAVVMLCYQGTCQKTGEPCQGTVKEDCVCTQQYDPVCGCDNKTYGNACTAQCAGITSFTKGECK